MARWTLVSAAAVAMGLSGCVTVHHENAALRMPRPNSTSPELLAYAPPNAEYPSVGGDILKGASPAEHEAQAPAPGDVMNAPPPALPPRP
jgi:hypothetical protein